jgi:hypothetical protein
MVLHNKEKKSQDEKCVSWCVADACVPEVIYFPQNPMGIPHGARINLR